MYSDPWLQRWLPLISDRAGSGRVLELGCGTGEDSAALAETGVDLVALDLSEDAVATAKERVPSANFLVQDIRDPFPLGNDRANVIVASLSLHYFSWAETLRLVARIRATLTDSGIFLCRLNSTNDHHFGASGHPLLDKNYYSVDGQPKRFFDRSSVEQLFQSGWNMLSLEEMITHKYAMPKSIWEAVLDKDV